MAARPVLKLAAWLGWVLVLWTWSELLLSWLLGVEVWNGIFAPAVDAAVWRYVPVIVGCLGVVLISIGRR